MIDPKFFQVSSEPDGRATRVTVELRLQGHEFIPPGRGLSREMVDDVSRKLQQRAWHEVYGDLDRKLTEMRHKILSSGGGMDFNYRQVNAAIDDVQSMVRNPFNNPAPPPNTA